MSFSSDINKFSKKADSNINKTFRGTALSLFSAVIMRTPVGNASLWKNKPPKNYTGGRLRGNWIARIGSPSSSIISKEDKTGGSTVRAVNSIVGKVKNGQSIFLSNNLPYAEAVENGSSTQAPKGIVKVTVMAFNRVLKAQARKANK